MLLMSLFFPVEPIGDRVVLGMLIRRDISKRDRVVRRPFELARGKHARRVAIQQQGHQHVSGWYAAEPRPAYRERIGCRSSFATTSTTKRARWSAGIHSCTLGGIKNNVSRSRA